MTKVSRTALPRFAGLLAGLLAFQQVLLIISPVEQAARLSDRVLFIALLAPLGLPLVLRPATANSLRNIGLAVVASAAIYTALIWGNWASDQSYVLLAVIPWLLVGGLLSAFAMLPIALTVLLLGAIETAQTTLHASGSTPLSDAGVLLLVAVPSVLIGAAIRRVGRHLMARRPEPLDAT